MSNLAINNNLKKGMSVIEVIVSIALFVVVLSGIFVFQVNVMSYNRQVTHSLQTAQDAQVILRTIEKEIRMMSTANNGSYPIVQADDDSFTFYSDIDNDGFKERIRYFVEGTVLKKGVLEPRIPLMQYVSQDEVVKGFVSNIRVDELVPVFRYYSNGFAGTEAPMSYPLDISNIRLVSVALFMDVDPNLSPLPRSYMSFITLRNLKDNL